MVSSMQQFLPGKFNRSLGKFRRSDTPKGVITAMSSYGSETHLAIVDGDLWVAGANTFGTLGLGHSNPVSLWQKTNYRASALSTSGWFSGFIEEGTSKLWVVGRQSVRTWSVLGLGHTNDVDTWTDTGMTAKYIHFGSDSGHLIDLNDDIWGTGTNNTGKLGTGDNTSVNVWTNTGVKGSKIYVGGNHTIALGLAGNVLLTGRGDEGQLAGQATRNTFYDTSLAASDIAAYSNCSFAIMSNGNLWGCGTANGIAEGMFNTGSASATNYNSFTDLGIEASEVAIGFRTLGVIGPGGTIWATGGNLYGDMGLGDNNDRFAFEDTGRTATQIFQGSRTVYCANGNTIYGSGFNNHSAIDSSLGTPLYSWTPMNTPLQEIG